MSTNESDPAREALARELLDVGEQVAGLLNDVSALEAACFDGSRTHTSCMTTPEARRFLRWLTGRFFDAEFTLLKRPPFASYHAWPGDEDYPTHPERAEVVDQINRARMWEGDPWGCAVGYPQEPLPE